MPATLLKPHDIGHDQAWRAMPHTLGRRLSRGEYKTPQHVKLISWLLVLNATGHLPRLGISEPPGTGKSELVDYYDPVYLLEHDPRRRIVLASYGSDLAQEQGKRVRNLIEDQSDLLSVRLLGDTRAADKWRTVQGGGMWTVGIGGPLTGRRASNMKIDDPHKNFAEAMAESGQLNVWNWYRYVARTRLLPRAPMAVIQTRWAEGDLLGRIATQDEKRDEWLFVRLPAIAEADESVQSILGERWVTHLHGRGVVIPDFFRREVGEPLWPELEPGMPWFDEEEYAAIRADVGEVVWAGLYQQRPAPLEGDLFKRQDWRRLDRGLPPGRYLFVRRWDFASTEGAGDWTAGCLMAMNLETRALYIVEMRRARLGPPDVKAFVAATLVEDKERYGKILIRVEREPGSSGKAVESDYMATVFQGEAAKFVPSTGDKRVRALPLSGQQGAGNLYLCRRDVGGGEWVVPEWWGSLIDEAAIFPHGSHDDLVDVASLAYVDLIEEAPRRSRAQVRSSARKTLGY